jgi:AcrR family transcriptional regulator
MSPPAKPPSAPARTPARRLPAAERRRQIVTAAARVFDRAGYAQATMEDIADEVGIAKTSLYYYFVGKDELLLAIHEDFIDLLLDRHTRRLQTGLAPEHLLLEVMGDILELMETHRGHVRVFFEHHRELPSHAQPVIRSKRDRYERAIQQLFDDGVLNGAIRANETRMTTLALFGMCNWAYQWYRVGGPMRTREIAYSFWTLLMHGVGVGPADRTLPLDPFGRPSAAPDSEVAL